MESSLSTSPSTPINIPNVTVNRDYLDEELMEQDDVIHGMTEILMRERRTPMGSCDMCYDSPKLPRPSNDFNHVMVKLNTNVKKMSSSCPVRGISGSPPLRSHESDTSLDYHLSSALSPASGRRRPRRNVRFDETTITVMAEFGDSAARFRSRWRQRHGMSSSPPIKFGSKNVTIQHNDDNSEENRIADFSLSPQNNGKSIFDVCNYSSYGRYT